MLGLKLNHVSKRGHWCHSDTIAGPVAAVVFTYLPGIYFQCEICKVYTSTFLHTVSHATVTFRDISFTKFLKLGVSHLVGHLWWRLQAKSRWHHQMKKKQLSALLALCAGNYRSPVNSPHKGRWRRALMFSLIYARIYGWINNPEAGDLRRHLAHYDDIVMFNEIVDRDIYVNYLMVIVPAVGLAPMYARAFARRVMPKLDTI